MVDGILTINVGGEDVQLLVTPRLCIYNGRENVRLSSNDKSSDTIAEGGLGYSLGADVLYCAALNHWDLTGKDIEDFHLHRIDFHRWAFEHPKAFVKAAQQALKALNYGGCQNGEDEEGSKKK